MVDGWVWVTNYNSDHPQIDIAYGLHGGTFMAGEPQASESMTVEALKAEGMVGIYRRETEEESERAESLEAAIERADARRHQFVAGQKIEYRSPVDGRWMYGLMVGLSKSGPGWIVRTGLPLYDERIRVGWDDVRAVTSPVDRFEPELREQFAGAVADIEERKAMFERAKAVDAAWTRTYAIAGDGLMHIEPLYRSHKALLAEIERLDAAVFEP